MYKVTRTSFAAKDADGTTHWLTKHSTHEEIAAIPGEELQKLIAADLVTETKDEPTAPAESPTPTPTRRTARTEADTPDRA